MNRPVMLTNHMPTKREEKKYKTKGLGGEKEK